MKEQMLFMLGIAIVVIMLGSVSIPLLLAPTVDSTGSAQANSTAVNNLSTTAIRSNQLLFNNPDTAASASVTLVFQRSHSNEIVLTDAKGTLLKNVTGTSPQTFSVSQASFLSGSYTSFNYTTNTTANNEQANVTSITVTPQILPQSTTQGWNGGVVTMWTIVLAIVLVASVLIYILR